MLFEKCWEKHRKGKVKDKKQKCYSNIRVKINRDAEFGAVSPLTVCNNTVSGLTLKMTSKLQNYLHMFLNGRVYSFSTRKLAKKKTVANIPLYRVQTKNIETSKVHDYWLALKAYNISIRRCGPLHTLQVHDTNQQSFYFVTQSKQNTVTC